MIEGIAVQIVWEGRNSGMTWFHPRGCMVPAPSGPLALLTCQDVTGSDYFGQVHASVSPDMGAHWGQPEPLAALGRIELPDGFQEGVCDVVPEYHAATDTVLAMGHNVFYHGGRLARPATQRYPVYVVRQRDGSWSSTRQRLMWEDPRGTAMYTCGCAQRQTLPDGNLLIALSYAPLGQQDRMVGSVVCSFDGSTVRVLEAGPELRLAVGRGLLEPTLTRFGNSYWMTIRAEDGHGYLSQSEDGLHWSPLSAWSWDDGQELSMSTTQQRWLTHSDGLYLVYTRQAEHNANVMRWRSPLYLAEVDLDRRCLIRATERTVFPLIGDGVGDPDHVARMGNFHVTNAAASESWITVGETRPADGWAGNTLLARVGWDRPNRLVGPPQSVPS
jgi:hypothetical protein